MIEKLAIRNAKRSLKDYLIYFITTVLSFSMVFSFYLIVFSEDINSLSSTMENFKIAVYFASGIIFFVIAYLVNYTIRFLFLKRSKEFGTYMILGIQKKDVSNLFLKENLLFGVVSLICSFFLGFILSQFFKMIIMNIFHLPYEIQFTFSMTPFLLTFAYFALIYFFVLMKSRRRFKKMKICDLLYLEKQNEQKQFKRKSYHVFLFLISLFLGVLGSVFLYQQFSLEDVDGANFGVILLSILFMLISIYGITLSVMDFVLYFIFKRKNIKYHGTNLFLIRMITSKVRSMGFTFETLSFLIFLTFISVNISNTFQVSFENQIVTSAPYDLMIFDPKNERFDEYYEYVDQTLGVQDSIRYFTYNSETNEVRKNISSGNVGYNKNDVFVKLSDYNKLLSMKNVAPISLNSDEFYVHSYRDVSKELERFFKTHKTITIKDEVLHFKNMTDKAYSTSWSRGSSYIIVIPDEVSNSLKKELEFLSINTTKDTSEQFSKDLKEKFPAELLTTIMEDGTIQYYQPNTFYTRGTIESENRSFITIIAFSLLYLAFIFAAVVGTILAIQALSDSEKYKHHYKILSDLGLNEKEIRKIIWRQLGLLFFVPVIYPFLLSIVVAVSTNQLFSFMMTSDYSILISLLTAVFLFLSLLFCYFLATYFSYKNNVIK